MSTTYRVAVIGTGGISRWHANYFVQHERAEVVAACDISRERLHKFGDEYHVEARYLDHRELLEKEGMIRYSWSEAALLNAQTGDWQPIEGEPQPDPATELIAWMAGGPEHRNAGRIAMVAQEVMMALYESARIHTIIRPPLEVDDSPFFQMMASGVLPEPEGAPYDIRSDEALEYALTGQITPKTGQDDTPKWIATPV